MAETPSVVLPAAWLAPLRDRMVAIARRRVPEDAVEDVVQDALKVIADRGPARAAQDGNPTPPLAWCFQVLRNVIGTWYGARRDTTDVDDVTLADTRPDPLESLDRAQRAQHVRRAMDALAANSADCARWLWAMADGRKPAALASDEGIETAAFYRRVYRCRRKLEELLLAEGVRP